MTIIGRILRFLTIVLTVALLPEAATWSPAAPLQEGSAARDPVQVGYAVVTPTSAATAGLVVFETFGEHRPSETTQAGVLPSDMTTHAILFVNAGGRLSRNLGVGIANPGSTAANVTLTLRDNMGIILATQMITVPAGNQTAKFVTELFAEQMVPRDLTGTLDISSDTPVAVLGMRFRGRNFSTIPATSLSPSSSVPLISTGVGGPAAVILADFATGGGWATELVIANTGPADLIVRVDLFGQDGKPLIANLNGMSQSSFTGIMIPKGGVVTLANPADEDDDF